MFSAKEFVKKGLIKSIGYEPDYKIYKSASGWYKEGLLEEADLEEIQVAIDANDAKNEITEEYEAINAVETESEV